MNNMNVAKLIIQDQCIDLVAICDNMTWIPWATCTQLVVFIEVEGLMNAE